MKSEKEKMLAGEMYDPLDPELAADRLRGRQICQRFNTTRPEDFELRRTLLAELLGTATDAWIEPPFYCDYGPNIRFGERVFLNFNCVVLDVMAVTLGDRVMVGPAVQIYTATHPLEPVARSSGREFARPVRIGSDVWLGGGAIICPGVSIGDRSVIGAGSVVTKDIPSDVVAAGNPARIIRRLTDNTRDVARPAPLP